MRYNETAQQAADRKYSRIMAEFPWFGGFGGGGMSIDCGPGWADIIRDLCIKLMALRFDGNVVQVKEKFGTLRFYADGLSEEQRRAVSDAEDRSALTCETCGAPGKARAGGWIKTLCDECARPGGRKIIFDEDDGEY